MSKPFVDLRSLGKPHDWEEFDDNVRQCLRCGELQRVKLDGMTHYWYTTLEGTEGLCEVE